MATAKFKSHFHAPHGHKLFRSNSSNNFPEKPIDEEQKQKEKDFIACFECNGTPLSPAQIAEDPRNKEVGLASKQLRVGDFNLIKTIGTGEIVYHPTFEDTLTYIYSPRHFCEGMVDMPSWFSERGPEGVRIEDTSQGRQ